MHCKVLSNVAHNGIFVIFLLPGVRGSSFVKFFSATECGVSGHIEIVGNQFGRSLYAHL